MKPYPKIRFYCHAWVLAITAMLLVLNGCIPANPGGQDLQPTMTAISIPATDTPRPAAKSPTIPTETATAPATPVDSSQTATIQPGVHTTPTLTSCDVLDLQHADLNQLFTNITAFRQNWKNQWQEAITPLAPLLTQEEQSSSATAIKTGDPTQVEYYKQKVEQFGRLMARLQLEMDLSICSLTNLWASPDGAWLAVRIGYNPYDQFTFTAVPVSSDPVWLVVYDTATLQPAWTRSFPRGMLNFKWSSTGELAALMEGSQTIQVVESASGKVVSTIPAPDPIVGRCEVGFAEMNFTWAENGQKILRKLPNKLETWDARTGARLGEVAVDDAASGINKSSGPGICDTFLEWSPDGRYFLTYSAYIGTNMPRQIWNVQTGKPLRRLETEGMHPRWSRTNLISQLTKDESVNISKALTGEQVDRQFDYEAGYLGQIEWSPDGSKLAIHYTKRIIIYDANTCKLMYKDFDKGYSGYFTWQADSKHLLIVHDVQYESQTLYLFDTDTMTLSGPGLVQGIH